MPSHLPLLELVSSFVLVASRPILVVNLAFTAWWQRSRIVPIPHLFGTHPDKENVSMYIVNGLFLVLVGLGAMGFGLMRFYAFFGVGVGY